VPYPLKLRSRDLGRVATVNINNINKRLDNLLAWLAKAEPDVVSLQELKAEQDAFPVNALRTLGYEAVWQGERSWNGVLQQELGFIAEMSLDRWVVRSRRPPCRSSKPEPDIYC